MGQMMICPSGYIFKTDGQSGQRQRGEDIDKKDKDKEDREDTDADFLLGQESLNHFTQISAEYL